MVSPYTSELRLQLGLYEISTVYKAVYLFLGRAFFHLQAVDGELVISIRPKTPSDKIYELIGELQNELIEQRVRDLVSSETEEIRKILYAQAFSRTNLVLQARDVKNALSDPEGIGLREGNSRGVRKATGHDV